MRNRLAPLECPSGHSNDAPILVPSVFAVHCNTNQNQQPIDAQQGYNAFLNNVVVTDSQGIEFNNVSVSGDNVKLLRNTVGITAKNSRINIDNLVIK